MLGELKKVLKIKGMLCFAVSMGLYFAWWNIYHEEGFLYLGQLSLQVASCLCVFGGVLLASLVLLALQTLQGKRPELSLLFCIIVSVQIISGGILDVGVAFGNDLLVICMQPLMSASFFLLLFIEGSALCGCRLIRIAAMLTLALATYAVANTLMWVVALFCPDFFVRVALHFALLAGAVVLSAMFLFKKGDGFCEKGNAESFGAACGDAIQQAKLSRQSASVPLPLIVHIASYAIIFGAMHALASGVVPIQGEKMLPSYFGVFVAAVLLVPMFPNEQHFANLWPKIRQIIYPLAMLGFILLPFAKEGTVYVSIAFSECAMDLYFALFFLAAFSVSSRVDMHFFEVIAKGAIVAAVALMIGVLAGDILKATVSLNSSVYSLMTAVAFVLLMAGTFWVGDDKTASRVWGLEKKLAPKHFNEKMQVERCEKLAAQNGLTKREQEVLLALVQGRSIGAIADEFFISPYTVRAHIAHIHAKLDVHSLPELQAIVDKTVI